MTDFRAFVAHLVALRLARNLPQRTIAARMGVCRSAISRFAKTTLPVIRICRLCCGTRKPSESGLGWSACTRKTLNNR
jgi:transcriptional regulator with XRE-family HTH domain